MWRMKVSPMASCAAALAGRPGLGLKWAGKRKWPRGRRRAGARRAQSGLPPPFRSGPPQAPTAPVLPVARKASEVGSPPHASPPAMASAAPPRHTHSRLPSPRALAPLARLPQTRNPALVFSRFLLQRHLLGEAFHDHTAQNGKTSRLPTAAFLSLLRVLPTTGKLPS